MSRDIYAKCQLDHPKQKISLAGIAIVISMVAVLSVGIAGIAGAFDRPDERVSNAITTSEIPILLQSAAISKIQAGQIGNGHYLKVTTQDGTEWTWDGRSDPSVSYKLYVKDGRTLYYGLGPDSLQSKEAFLVPIVKDIQSAKARMERYHQQEAKAADSWK